MALVSLLGACLLATSAAAQQTEPLHGQKHESRREIDRLEERWREAILHADTAAMDSLLADDFVAITASGTLQTKEQALTNLGSGRLHIVQLNLSDRKVRFYGSTAVVTSLAEIAGTNQDGEIAGSFRYMRVYVRDMRGVWKIVSFEASRIRGPGERK
jgi:ketosteroid isomerase-like protein